MRIYVDSDVLIWHLRGERKALRLLRKLHRAEDLELWTGAPQRAEVVFFMRPEEEEATTLLLSLFDTAPIDQALVDAAGAIFRRWHSSHGVDVSDAFLAATAMRTGGRIYTLNAKHYPMPDVLVTKAW